MDFWIPWLLLKELLAGRRGGNSLTLKKNDLVRKKKKKGMVIHIDRTVSQLAGRFPKRFSQEVSPRFPKKGSKITHSLHKKKKKREDQVCAGEEPGTECAFTCGACKHNTMQYFESRKKGERMYRTVVRTAIQIRSRLSGMWDVGRD